MEKTSNHRDCALIQRKDVSYVKADKLLYG